MHYNETMLHHLKHTKSKESSNMTSNHGTRT